MQRHHTRQVRQRVRQRRPHRAELPQHHNALDFERTRPRGASPRAPLPHTHPHVAEAHGAQVLLWKSVSTHVAPDSYARLMASTVFCGTALSHMPRWAMLIISTSAKTVHAANAQQATTALFIFSLSSQSSLRKSKSTCPPASSVEK